MTFFVLQIYIVFLILLYVNIFVMKYGKIFMFFRKMVTDTNKAGSGNPFVSLYP